MLIELCDVQAAEKMLSTKLKSLAGHVVSKPQETVDAVYSKIHLPKEDVNKTVVMFFFSFHFF
jgi:hypothetical protein